MTAIGNPNLSPSTSEGPCENIKANAIYDI